MRWRYGVYDTSDKPSVGGRLAQVVSVQRMLLEGEVAFQNV